MEMGQAPSPSMKRSQLISLVPLLQAVMAASVNIAAHTNIIFFIF